MSVINQVVLAGRLGRDPELRHTSGGKAVAGLSLAVYAGGTGDQKKTDWFKVTAWGSLAERAAESLTKGTEVVITGRLVETSWEDKKSGETRKSVEIVATSIGFGEDRAKAAVSGQTNQTQEVSDDSIPF